MQDNQNSDLFIESENNKSFIKKIVDKIKKVIQNIIDKITQFFNKNKISDQMLNEASHCWDYRK